MHFQRGKLFHGRETPLKISAPNKHDLYPVAKEVYFSTFSLITLKMSRFPQPPLITITPMTPMTFSAVHYKTMISLVRCVRAFIRPTNNYLCVHTCWYSEMRG